MDKKIIHSVFEHTAARHPDKIAVQELNRQINYQTLNVLANRLASAMRQLGADKGQVIAVAVPSSIGLVASLLGAFKVGGLYLPINLSFPTQKLQYILRQCAPNIIVVREYAVEAFVRQANELDIHWKYLLVLSEDDSFRAVENTENDAKAVALEDAKVENFTTVSHPDDGNYIFYTSGSTGEPKAILGCHKSLGHFIDWETNEFDLDASCRVSQLSSTTFDASLRDIFVPLCTGGTLVIPPEEVRTNMPRLAEWLEESRITLVHTVPSVMRTLCQELTNNGDTTGYFRRLQYLMLSGEALFAKDALRWREVAGDQVTLVNLYGATETTLIRTFHRVGKIGERPAERIPVGQPISHTLVAVINDGIACRKGEIGEVYIKSPFMTKGYRFDPHLQAQRFVQNPLSQDQGDIVYRTGDLGRLLENGDLELLGRMDHQVKVNGIRVELDEVERATRSLKGVEEVAVLLHTNKDLAASLVCYYTGQHYESAEMQHLLSEQLEPPAIPRWTIHLDTMPLNINGKVDRKALARREILVDETTFTSPETDTEVRLEKIWREVLNLPRVGIEASFFTIGGTSLKAIQVISRIYKEFEVLLKISDVFDNVTIKALASLITTTAEKDYNEVTPVPEAAYYPATYAQKRLWIVNQLEEGQVAYNMPCVYRLKGMLHIDTFRQALYEVVKRHEVLRTTFANVEGQPVQKIHELTEIDLTLLVEDIRGDSGRQRIKQLADTEWNQPFDLEKGPLFRIILVLVDEEDFVLLFNIHHIIADAWTLDILTYELFNIYEAIHQGKSTPLPPLKVQYKDFAAWENKQLAGELLEKHRRFWLKQFEGTIPVLTFPQARRRPERVTYQGSSMYFELTEHNQALHELAEKNDVTFFMLLISLTKLLLYRYSGQNDLVVGMPTANRNHKDLENQAGFYVNTLAIRTAFDATIMFPAFLQKIKNNLLAVYDHAMYPLDLLIEDLGLKYDQSRHALFDVMVQIQDTQASVQGAKTMDDFEITKLELTPPSSKFDFTFNFHEDEERLFVQIEYNTDIYEESFVKEMKTDMSTLAEEVCQDDNRPLSDLRNQLLRGHEKQLLEEQLNAASSELSNDY